MATRAKCMACRKRLVFPRTWNASGGVVHKECWTRWARQLDAS